MAAPFSYTPAPVRTQKPASASVPSSASNANPESVVAVEFRPPLSPSAAAVAGHSLR